MRKILKMKININIKKKYLIKINNYQKKNILKKKYKTNYENENRIDKNYSFYSNLFLDTQENLKDNYKF